MYHFIGIKGTGMSALAIVLHDLGYDVNGSDVEKHFFTEEGLIKNNISITTYDESNIKENMKIIKGASIKDDNPELIKANELNLNIYEYNEMVGVLTRKFKTVCIAGCHGKTTTTTMLSNALKNIKKISYLIGDGTGYADRESEYFILESCEYQRHFLAYQPYYAIITNIDFDHVDYYKNIDDVINAYQEFALKADKMVIACGDDPYTHLLEVNKPIFYYGLEDDNDIIATNIEYKTNGTSFDVLIEGNYYGFFDLPIYGKYQLLDALAAISVCYYERIESKEVSKALKTFNGAKRRFNEIIAGDSIIIDDYAHHPNEIKATLKAVKQKYPDKKIVSIFQPHTFTRTKEFASDIAAALNKSDYSYVLDIHPAREKQEDYPDVTSKLIIDNLENGSHINIDDAEVLSKYNNTVFVFMSPNDISKLEMDLKNIKEKHIL